MPNTPSGPKKIPARLESQWGPNVLDIFRVDQDMNSVREKLRNRFGMSPQIADAYIQEYMEASKSEQK